MSENRASYAEGVSAGLVALRAQGLEPSDYAKELAARVANHEITPGEMERALVAYHRNRSATVTRGR